ncbi:Uncharacterized membrane protein YkvA, DUF1232 family [Oceanobacillus limi]|uniref:Uncharacterized membrane protein YkvA, DUF1232 family n=1 Tax=Oceanobacillus limi TaxID=930131 RepID=A0A1I0EQD5_9BACI|nr:YkvA family protein [Oceanobacillus limi]SET47726.1 Uncharacterized membrane protein YkvA, DUF1232 family [Oceanobacillus limi]
MKKIKDWAKNLKRQIYVLYFAYKHDNVPWYAKVFAACIVAYAFSPIDLIPDFIPVLGYLDEVIILPLGIMIALKMIPKETLAECEKKASYELEHRKPKNWIMGTVIITLWSIIFLWGTIQGYQLLQDKAR